ncbi:hypothetical protein BT96DRAFT_935760 [Gymnopus androsaceus JB14]|uniref:Uncharacterized protein n=1 Tax=Gymnopus androsaceus JB14 TaxID=1447944 RepID=A0A6A4I6H7_9AGAR|nr:hypothetical protein BT96DRAFT_935760 [Gymnopus androsaceus JB14]
MMMKELQNSILSLEEGFEQNLIQSPGLCCSLSWEASVDQNPQRNSKIVLILQIDVYRAVEDGGRAKLQKECSPEIPDAQCWWNTSSVELAERINHNSYGITEDLQDRISAQWALRNINMNIVLKYSVEPRPDDGWCTLEARAVYHSHFQHSVSLPPELPSLQVISDAGQVLSRPTAIVLGFTEIILRVYRGFERIVFSILILF